MRKKTNEEFLNEVYDLVGNEYTFLDKYVNTRTKIKVKHNKCGNIYEVRPNDFLRESHCPYCNGNHKKTTQDFKEEIKKLYGNDYSILGEYKNSTTKIKVKHNKCGNTYKVEPNSFLQGHGCPYCANNIKKTTQQFKEEVYNLVGDEYTVLGEYKNNHTKIKMKHNKCGSVYQIQPSSFLSGHGCSNSKCSRNKPKKTNDEYTKELKDKKLKYTNLEKYKGALVKIKHKCLTCGYIWDIRPNDILNGYGCPICNQSKGEDKIKDYLDSHQIKYIQHKHFDWLKYKGSQHLDFYLEDYKVAIEFDGEFHSQLVRKSKHETLDDIQNRLKNNILRDNNKNKLLYQHNIKLIRISYWKKDDIESILDKELTKYK